MELSNTYYSRTPIERLERLEGDNTTGGVNDSQTGTTTSTSYNSKNTKEEFDFEFPPGYRFRPTDEELIVYYLTTRIMNLPLPHNKIKDVNLYLTPPHILAAEYTAVEENEWYFFTPRDRKYPNGDRPDRGVGKESKTGYWKATGADNKVLFQGQPVGSKKSLVYYQIEGNPPKGVKTNWIMHEYRILEISERKRKKTHPKDMKLDDWVLCKIYNKNEKPTRSSRRSKVDNMSNSKTTNSDEANMDNMKEAVAEADDEDNVFSAENLLAFCDDSVTYDYGYYDYLARPFDHCGSSSAC